MPRVLGLDPGEARIGVAVSDPTSTIASPHSYIDVVAGNAVQAINAICVDLEVDTVVVGLPLRLDSSEGPAAERSRLLGQAIDDALDVSVRYWDERFTTVTAEEALIEGNVRRSKRKTTRDQVAAAVMLQGYLDRQAAGGR
jgi:putative Holliday junction resolvase